MAAQDIAGVAEGTLAIQEKAKLRKVLHRFGLVLFTVCAIVSLDSVAAAAEAVQGPLPDTGEPPVAAAP